MSSSSVKATSHSISEKKQLIDQYTEQLKHHYTKKYGDTGIKKFENALNQALEDALVTYAKIPGFKESYQTSESLQYDVHIKALMILLDTSTHSSTKKTHKSLSEFLDYYFQSEKK